MPPQPRVEESELLDRLVEVFRRHGFEGASLTRISEATGLQRASLYHRFPGGKEEMVAAAVARVADRFGPLVIEPLESAGDPAERVRTMVTNLQKYYDRGRSPCVLDTLSIGPDDDPIRPALHASMRRWRQALEKVARDAGAPAVVARARAEDALVRIEGALVVSRVQGSTAPFRRAIAGLVDLLASP
ncbi:MAG: TetR/AcrR family transcriptional regulator [Phycisphaerales bacterium]